MQLQAHGVPSPSGATVINPGMGPTMGGDLVSLLANACGSPGAHLEVTRAALRRALELLEAERAPATGDPATGRCALATWQVRRVVGHVEQHLASTICVGDLAAQVRLSTSYFSRAFKGSFGQAPHTYVIARRIERAKHQMLTTGVPLCEIALACGFADQAHFSRVFRRVVGATPNAWRRTNYAGAELAIAA